MNATRERDMRLLQQLKYDYAAACDGGYDGDRIAALFTPDCVWASGSIELRGQAELAEFMSRLGVERISWAAHLMMNPVITFSPGGDKADAHWLLVQFSSMKDDVEGGIVTSVGRYEDQLARVDGQWKFHRVHLTVEKSWTSLARAQ